MNQRARRTSSNSYHWSAKPIVAIWAVILIITLALPTMHGFGQGQNNHIVPPGNSHTEFDRGGMMTNQIIVKFRDSGSGNRAEGLGMAQVGRMSSAAGVALTHVRGMSGDAHVFSLPATLNRAGITNIIDTLNALPEVEYAEPDHIMQHTAIPNDPRYPEQWHYFAPVPGNYGINLPPAWELLTDDLPRVVVAVIDTGLTGHVEFEGQTVPGYDFISDPRVANDGDGRDDDPSDPGDWITAEESASGFFAGCQISNSSWHGTHVAGTIAAATNNDIGVAGVNWTAKILPVRVLGKCGGYTSDIVDGMRWAAGLPVPGVPANPNPARVLNLSLGGSGACSASYQNVINDINAVGATVIAAAGNSEGDAGSIQPANCAGVITVAATNIAGNKASYSNSGDIVDISAPGGDSTGYILSTVDTGTQSPEGDTYAGYQGTSMAAPHVSGVASLLYAFNDSLHWHHVLAIMQSTVTPFPEGSSCKMSICGSGIVNAYAALQLVEGTLPPAVPPTYVTASEGSLTDKVRITWETSSDAAFFQVFRSTTDSLPDASILIGDHPASPFDDTSAVPGITYHYWIKACNIGGCSGFSSSVSGRRGILIYLPLIITR